MVGSYYFGSSLSREQINNVKTENEKEESAAIDLFRSEKFIDKVAEEAAEVPFVPENTCEDYVAEEVTEEAKAKETDDDVMKCEHCDFTSVWKTGLMVHVSRKHDINRK